MRVAQSVYRDHWHPRLLAYPREVVVGRRVVNLIVLSDKDGAFFWKVLYQDGELNYQLPVNLDLPDGGPVLCWHEAPAVLVVPSFAYGQDRKSVV